VIEPPVHFQLAYSISKMGEARCVTSRVTVNMAYHVQNLTASQASLTKYKICSAVGGVCSLLLTSQQMGVEYVDS
jgi:hypothetical protein